MSDTKLATNPVFAGVPQVANPFEKEFGSFTSALYLPRIQLEGSSSNNVKKKKIAAGNYALITGRDQFEDLGEKVDILVLTYRSKALDMRDTKKVLASYNKESPLFKEIMAKASSKDSSTKKGYMYGLEFLVYVPSAKHEVKFATFYCGSPTSRVAAKNFGPILKSQKRTATLSHEVISTAEYTWEGPVIRACNTPLAHYPSTEDMHAQMEMFLNPSEGIEPEMASDEEASSTERDR